MGLNFAVNPNGPEPDWYNLSEKDRDDWYDQFYWPKGVDRVAFSYGGFNQFRTRVAAAEGIDLNKMEGYFSPEGPYLASGRAPDRPIPWDVYDTPLTPFLNHSDCDGNMTYEECQQVAPRLKAICEGWADALPMYGGGWKEKGLTLAELMLAVPEGQTLEFT